MKGASGRKGAEEKCGLGGGKEPAQAWLFLLHLTFDSEQFLNQIKLKFSLKITNIFQLYESHWPN